MVVSSRLIEKLGASASSEHYGYERPPLGRDESNPGSTYSLISGGDVDEGGTIQFTIRRSGGLTFPGEIQFQVKSGSAKKGVDFTVDGEDGYQPIAFSAVDASEDPFPIYQEQIISVVTVDDDIVEMDESLMALIRSSYSGDRISGSISQAKIDDNDVISKYSLSATANKVDEGEAFELVIDRTSDLKEATVALSLKGSGAEIGADVTDIGQVDVSFDVGESQQVISLATIDDTEVEITEGFFARIKSDSRNDEISQGIKYLEIKDNDVAAQYNLLKPELTNEGDNISFVVERTSGGDRDGAFYFWTKNGTAKKSDITPRDKEVIVFPANQDQVTIEIETNDDTVVEDKEFFYGYIKPYYKTDRVSKSSRKAKIEDNDLPTTYTLNVLDSDSNASTEFEEGDSITFEVTRSQSESSGSVRLKLRSATARSKKDFTPPSDETIVFEEGVDTVVVNVPVVDDYAVEENEKFFANLRLDNRKDEINGGRKTIKITDDDTLTSYQLSFIPSDETASEIIGGRDASEDEGSDVTFRITRSGGDLSSTGKVRLKTMAGSASDPEDFVGLEKQVVKFEENETQKDFIVSTVSDNLVERDETFTASIRAINKKDQIANRQQFVTIMDDDEPAEFALTASEATVEEGSSFSIDISKTGGAGRTSSALVWTTNGTAKSGSDYEKYNVVQVDFLSGDSTAKTVEVSTLADDDDETISGSGEYFYFNIKPLDPSDSVVESQLKLTISDPIASSDSEVVDSST